MPPLITLLAHGRRLLCTSTRQARRFDPADLGEQLYKEIAETHWTLQCNLYQAADLSLSDSGTHSAPRTPASPPRRDGLV